MLKAEVRPVLGLCSLGFPVLGHVWIPYLNLGGGDEFITFFRLGAKGLCEP